MNQTMRALFVVAALGAAAVAQADAPSLIPVQGVLTDADGVPLPGPVSLQISLHNVATGGSALWSDNWGSLGLVDGAFVVYLGQSVALPLTLFRDHPALWVQLKVNADPPMSRIQLGSAPYTGFAQYCGLATGFTRGAQACTGSDVMTGLGADGLIACAPVAGLTEAQVDAYVANNGYATTASLAAYATTASLAALAISGSWADLQSVPPGFADGVDNDALMSLGCAAGTLPVSTGSGWTCGQAVTSVATGTGLKGGPITATGTVAIDTSVVPLLDAANAFTGTQSIQPAGAASVGLVVRGAAGQIANLQEWQTSTGNVRASINGGGLFSGQLDAADLFQGTVPSARVSGAYAGITGIAGQSYTAATTTTAFPGSITTGGYVNGVKMSPYSSTSAVEGAVVVQAGTAGKLVRTTTARVFRLERNPGLVQAVWYVNGTRSSVALSGASCAPVPPACASGTEMTTTSCCLISMVTPAPTMGNPTDFRIILGLTWGGNPFAEAHLWNYSGDTWEGYTITQQP